MANKDSMWGTVRVALILCVVCSVFVSAAAVLLRPEQLANKLNDRKKNILAAAGLLQPNVDIDTQFARIDTRLVDLNTGKFTQAFDVASFDQRKASKNPALATALSAEEDKAGIKRREDYALVYIVNDGDAVDKVILPIKGYGLWSTLYGFIALDKDINTVVGVGFYEHAETPGLGGEIDNPLWKAKWVGKKVYSEEGDTALSVIKGEVDRSRPQAVYQIDGLSGATLTSRGVHNLIQFWMGDKGFAQFLANLRAGEA